MNELTDEEIEILNKIRKASKERRKIPKSERKYVPRPERYNYPIGIDPEGNPYPVRQKIPEAEKTRELESPDQPGSTE